MATPKKPKLKIGQIVAITFDDHSSDSQEFRFVATGIVYRLTRTTVVLANWCYADDADLEIDENCSVFSLVRKAVVDVKILGEYPFPEEPKPLQPEPSLRTPMP